MPAPIYRPNMDSGIVTFDADGNVRSINWRAWSVGFQYYLPIATAASGCRRTTRSSSRPTSPA
jgi:hypothetical protein